LKEIVTLFDCLPFTNFSISILPITSDNFYLFFIAFIVTFFLLGIIIGYILNPRRRLRKTKDKPLMEAVKQEPVASIAPGQDIPANNAEPRRRMDSRDPRYGNYNSNYRDYPNPTRRY
jgi:hypothetical protein